MAESAKKYTRREAMLTFAVGAAGVGLVVGGIVDFDKVGALFASKQGDTTPPTRNLAARIQIIEEDLGKQTISTEEATQQTTALAVESFADEFKPIIGELNIDELSGRFSLRETDSAFQETREHILEKFHSPLLYNPLGYTNPETGEIHINFNRLISNNAPEPLQQRPLQALLGISLDELHHSTAPVVWQKNTMRTFPESLRKSFYRGVAWYFLDTEKSFTSGHSQYDAYDTEMAALISAYSAGEFFARCGLAPISHRNLDLRAFENYSGIFYASRDKLIETQLKSAPDTNLESFIQFLDEYKKLVKLN